MSGRFLNQRLPNHGSSASIKRNEKSIAWRCKEDLVVIDRDVASTGLTAAAFRGIATVLPDEITCCSIYRLYNPPGMGIYMTPA